MPTPHLRAHDRDNGDRVRKDSGEYGAGGSIGLGR